MNKYSRQLRIGRIFVCSASSGRKYAILADFTQCLVTQRFTLFCCLLSPFLRCRTGFFALRKSPFHVAIWYVRHRHTGNLAMRKSLFRPLSSHFSPPVSPKTPPRHPFFRSLTHISHHIRSSFPISRCQYFLLLKTYKYTFPHRIPVPSYLPRRPPSSHLSPHVSPKTPPRHPFFRFLTHISHHIRSSFPISRCQTFFTPENV